MIVNIYRIVPDGKKKQLRTTARESFRFQSSAKKLKSRTICANVYTCILYPKYAVTNSSIASIETLSTNSFLKILSIYHFYSDPIQNFTPSLTFLDTTRSSIHSVLIYIFKKYCKFVKCFISKFGMMQL